MLTVLHIVGESDTGQTDLRQIRLAAREDRLRAWRRAVGDGGPDAAELLRCGRLPGEPPPPFGRTPLAELLASLEPGEIDLLLLSTTTGALATVPIQESLIAAVAAQPDALGRPVGEACGLVATGFGEDVVAPLVRDTLLARPPGQVVMSWGSASTGLALGAVAGIIEAGRPLWLRTSKPPCHDVTLAPPAPSAPLVPWLLRLGYPEQIGLLNRRGQLHPPPEADLLDHAKAVATRLDRVGRGEGDAADLAEWVRADLRRLDPTAGLALRAWIAEEYRAQRTGEGGLDLLAWATDRLAEKRPGTPATLGLLRNRLWAERRTTDPPLRAALDAPSGRWLLHSEIGMVNRDAGDSTHDARGISPEVMDVLRRRLPAEPGPWPGVLGLPSGEVAVVWPVGTSGHNPYAETLLARPPSAALLRHCGLPHDGRIALSCLLLGTEGPGGSRATADAQARALPDNGVHHGRVRGHLVPVEALAVPEAERAVDGALAAHAAHVDAIVVVPVGPKELVLGGLLAALRAGQARAVPVLLAGTDRDAPEAGYHRVVPYLGADRVITELAARALRRLELGTAARLCDLGSPTVRELVGELDALRERLWRDDGVGLHERLSLCADRLAPVPGEAFGEPDRVRLVVLAGELARRIPPRFRNAATARLIGVRGRLVITHGQLSVRAAIAAVTPAGPALTAPRLVQDAARGVPPNGQDAPAARYRAIERALSELSVGAAVRAAVALDNAAGG